MNCLDYVVREEAPGDESAIEELTRAAFDKAPHAAHTEHLIVNALREADALTISLVAETEGEIVGHVAVSPVGFADGSTGWYGLGPISVLPEYQHQGIGSSLMLRVIEHLTNIGAAGCVLVGDPSFYNRFSFRADSQVVYPGVPAAYCLVLKLRDLVPHGEVVFHPAFSIAP